MLGRTYRMPLLQCLCCAHTASKLLNQTMPLNCERTREKSKLASQIVQLVSLTCMHWQATLTIHGATSPSPLTIPPSEIKDTVWTNLPEPGDSRQRIRHLRHTIQISPAGDPAACTRRRHHGVVRRRRNAVSRHSGSKGADFRQTK